MEKSLADNEETTALDQEIPPPLLQPAANAPDPTRNDTSVTKVTAEHITTLDDKPEYMKGWRLYMLTAGIWIALFLSTLETTIVSTSLVSIADSLSGFEERNWVVTAYFLTYTGACSSISHPRRDRICWPEACSNSGRAHDRLPCHLRQVG